MFVEKYIEKEWEWGQFGLSCNPSITPSFIEKHVDKPWYWGSSGLSRNPSITLSFVEKYINKSWTWGTLGLSSNHFENDNLIKMKEEIKERKIKNGLNKLNDLVFFKYTGNPYHPIGKRRIEKQYDELMKSAPSSYKFIKLL